MEDTGLQDATRRIRSGRLTSATRNVAIHKLPQKHEKLLTRSSEANMLKSNLDKMLMLSGESCYEVTFR